MNKRILLSLSVLFGLGAGLTSCKSAYYGAMEKFGVHKRDILVDRVEEGRDSQEKAKEQFQTTLEAFKAVEDFDGGELEKVYKKLQKEYDRSVDRRDQVKGRIESIEKVAKDLFKEWETEIDQIQSTDLKKQSTNTLDDTRSKYGELVTAMKKAESRMDPVLQVFSDHVLFLKHNLNAQAIASLEGSLVSIENDVGQLIQEMESSIAEANSFINSMES